MTHSIAVVTLANAARLNHVMRQAELIPPGIDHIVIALNDADELRGAIPTSTVIDNERPNLALARNRGGDHATTRGADLTIFLDADCLPTPELFDYYQTAATRKPNAVLAGPVTYLPQGQLRTTNPNPHPARRFPNDGELQQTEKYELFWSLSFAVTTPTWKHIRTQFGGFDPGYDGYGAEDTDFAQHLRTHNIPLYWVGGAHAFHQWHPVSDPPVEHLHDIITNATRFHQIWGFWPMSGWLNKFQAAGLAQYENGTWKIVKK